MEALQLGTAGSKEELVKRPIAADTCLPAVLRLYGLTEPLLISLVRLAEIVEFHFKWQTILNLRSNVHQNKPVYKLFIIYSHTSSSTQARTEQTINIVSIKKN